LTSRPFLPPAMVRTNLLIGTSGRASRVPRIRPLTESMRPTASRWNWPSSEAARSGKCEARGRIGGALRL
jgi:hypothetical protein